MKSVEIQFRRMNQLLSSLGSSGEQSAAEPQHQAALDVRSGQHHPQGRADGHHHPGAR